MSHLRAVSSRVLLLERPILCDSLCHLVQVKWQFQSMRLKPYRRFRTEIQHLHLSSSEDLGHTSADMSQAWALLLESRATSSFLTGHSVAQIRAVSGARATSSHFFSAHHWFCSLHSRNPKLNMHVSYLSPGGTQLLVGSLRRAICCA